MPKSAPDPAPAAVGPDRLRPYTFHGLDLAVRGGHGVGDCPFCGGAGKFSADVELGLWRCFTCGAGTERGGGNALTFLRLLHDLAGRDPGSARPSLGAFAAAVAADRRLAGTDAVRAWGVRPSPVDGTWLVPGYASDGRLEQLYRRVRLEGKWVLLPTPGIWPDGRVHALHLPADDFDPEAAQVYVCEGPWDGMALWEAARGSRAAPCQVIAVPGCNVWRDVWGDLCRHKVVTLLYDSDHPRTEHERQVRAGYDGMARVAKRLSGVAAQVRWLRWGAEGYDPLRPSGWDVRDHLSAGPDRRQALTDLLAKVEDAPADWFVSGAPVNGQAHRPSVEARECRTWSECEAAWRVAMMWRQDMSDALAVLLAVCASTKQGGNQLFLQLVGSAGSGKTTMCDGLLVSQHCHHLEHLTGFHSGWKKPDEQGKDCSLIARINGKTLVTPEADVLLQSPQFHQLMAQQRRIFDGKSGATYKNSDEDRVYVGLRTPWIMAGTPAMMDHDQSHLGDRFLRFIIADPPDDTKRSILKSALRSERRAMLESANGTAGSLVDPQQRVAHALTGGYVDWLRANVEEALARVDVSDAAEEQCIDLAELSADLRARPQGLRKRRDEHQEPHECKELPTRLARQNVRLAACLAVVLNRPAVDAEVMRVVRKVALDTAHGHSLNVVAWMCAPNPRAGGRPYQETGGHGERSLAGWSGMTDERVATYMSFLKKVGVVEYRQAGQVGGYVLTDRVYDLYLRVMSWR